MDDINKSFDNYRKDLDKDLGKDLDKDKTGFLITLKLNLEFT